MYPAVLERLRGQAAPIFDLGCGVGLLGFFLREEGVNAPLIGVDHDAAKVEAATEIGRRYAGLEFRVGDARDAIPAGVNVVALDVLHYFTDSEQERIIDNIARAVPAGGVAVIRDAVRDGSIRYRVTAAQETFSRAVRWLKAERLNFPTRERIVTPFCRLGFSEEVVPMWGKTPFNNYLFVFSRPVEGMTNA